MKTVACYNETINKKTNSYMLDAWISNWSRHGYQCVVCGPQDARGWTSRRMRLDRCYKAIYGTSIGMVKDAKYCIACWRRWLAYDAVAFEHGSVLAVDTDLFNIGLHLPPCSDKSVTLLDGHCPCAVLGRGGQFSSFLDAMIDALEERSALLSLKHPQVLRDEDSIVFTRDILEGKGHAIFLPHGGALKQADDVLCDGAHGYPHGGGVHVSYRSAVRWGARFFSEGDVTPSDARRRLFDLVIPLLG